MAIMKKKKGSKRTLIPIRRMSEIENVDSFKTNSFLLNKVTGIGGIPKAKVIEIEGAEATGKTTLVIQTLANILKDNPKGEVLYIDCEHGINPQYAKQLGLDLNRVYHSQPLCAEDAFDTALQYMEEVDNLLAVVFDSTDAMTPRAEIEGEMDESQSIAQRARIIAKGLRKLNPLLKDRQVSLIFISQVREKIGEYIKTEQSTGGRALRFYSSLRLRVRQGEKMTSGENRIGHKLKVSVIKNRFAPPFQEVEIPLLYGKGVYLPLELVQYCYDNDIITRAGAYLKYESYSVQGIQNFVALVEKDNKLKEKLMAEINKATLKVDEELKKQITEEDEEIDGEDFDEEIS